MIEAETRTPNLETIPDQGLLSVVALCISRLWHRLVALQSVSYHSHTFQTKKFPE